MLKRVLGVLTDAVEDSDYQGVITWNDGLVYSNGIADIDYNTTNLKITGNKINTIQDINTTATPQFTGVKVDKIQAITDSATAITIEDTTGTDIITIDTVTPATNVYANLNIYGDITQKR